MTTPRRKETRNPVDVFKTRTQETADMAKAIAEAMEAFLKGDQSDRNWADVGDASHYHEQIKEIHDQLFNLGEFEL